MHVHLSHRAPRPGLRAAILGVSGGLIVVAAFLVATTVSDHLATTATDESVRTSAAVVHAYIDPLVMSGSLVDPTTAQAGRIDAELARLVSSKQILRVKIWSPTGVVLFSDLSALIGKAFPIDDKLSEALAGQVATDYSSADAPENVFERGLASQFLSIYLPISGPGHAAGAYEIYQDAAPIEAQIAATRQDVLLIVGAMALGLLALLFVGFSGASRLLTRQARRLRRSEERFRSLVQNSADVNMVMRPDWTIVYESPAVGRVLGYTVREHRRHSVIDMVHPDDREWAAQFLAEVARIPGAQQSGELRLRHADGTWRYVELVMKNLLDDPAVEGLVVNYRDVTARRALEDELKRQAFHDSLTGLANRALFADRLDHALARTRRLWTPLAVLFVDLDDFKTVNDSLGHAEGDRLLVAVAARLGSALRAGDTIARMGGDEFAILIEDPVDAGAPAEVVRRLLAALEAPFQIGAKDLFVHASVGIAGSVDTSLRDGGEDLLRNADIAMYTAKANGKNRVEVFQPSMHAAALARLALKGDLERALARREFVLLYQPIMNLASGELVGVEALLRWEHPLRGTVGPTEFIPVAEETGLIIPIGAWVLDEACRQAMRWDAAGPTRLALSVNVSGRQLQDPGFVGEVAAALSRTAFEPARLTLELTETILMQDADAATLTLNLLKGLGVRLAIDDFGTGYSSLNYLRRFPIDELKIDRSFVATMADGPEHAAVVLSILKLGETLHMDTVAEGIEHEAQMTDLRSLGADLGQGFYFARPLTADAIMAILTPEASAADQGHSLVA